MPTAVVFQFEEKIHLEDLSSVYRTNKSKLFGKRKSDAFLEHLEYFDSKFECFKIAMNKISINRT